METNNSTLLYWAFILVQLSGLLSVALVRLPVRREMLSFFQAAFFLSLLFVGLVTMISIGAGSSSWIAPGTTFSVMAVGGVLDLSRTSASTVF